MTLPSQIQACIEAPVIVAPSILDEAANHFVWLGYEAKKTDDGVDIWQSGRYSWLVRDFRGGLLFRKIFSASEAGQKDAQAMVSFANALNVEASLLRFYVDGKGNLAIESWYPNLYERRSFGRYVGLIDIELRDLCARRKAQTNWLLA